MYLMIVTIVSGGVSFSYCCCPIIVASASVVGANTVTPLFKISAISSSPDEDNRVDAKFL